MVLIKQKDIVKKTYVKGSNTKKDPSKKVHVRGGIKIFEGSGVLDVLSGLPWGKILPAVGGVAASSLASYGVQKAADMLTRKSEIPKQEILPVTENNIVHVDPKIDTLEKKPRERKIVSTSGIQGRQVRKGGKLKNVDKLLDQKSRDILQGLRLGKGLYNM